MPKRHGSLEEDSIGPSRASTANYAQLASDASVAFGPEMMRMAHHLNGPTFGHAILSTPELLARLPAAMPA
jgi:hypothetical protein